MRIFLTRICGVLLFVLGASASAAEAQLSIEAAQAKLKATFTNLTVIDFKAAPVAGLYEVNMGGRIVYYHPQAEVLIFGEIFSKDGRSLTAESLALTAAEIYEQLPLEKALVVGPEDGIPIIEFTDPDCPYCRQYHEFISVEPVKRLIFFETRIHPGAKAKAIHILCAEEPSAAFLDIYSGQQPARYNDCDAGRAMADEHLAISRQAGVNATPTLILDRTLVTGFRRQLIADHIQKHSASLD